ncbi:sugar transferase [Listeria aquatica]|uniref:Sugar transferase n=1 Tax=Listeria aquatica TaxID=1494960 RepID=A0A841ZL79_9LIST|nr:sugar transferase [Listeria aquatica]MBC1520282.1 sugar transferase [Listeria aquatica]
MKKRTRLLIKHSLDRIVASLLLLLFFVPLLVLSIILAIYYKSNPFYCAERAGINGKLFKQYKFKSMYDVEDNEKNGDIDRVSPLGSFLRSWSIDELPQLINIVKGDISFIGPRPLTPEYIPLYSDREKKRLNVKPGLTGLAQVKGRNSLSWKEKFLFDIQYVEEMTLLLDLKICLQTVKIVLNREGVQQDEAITSERFNGHDT